MTFMRDTAAAASCTGTVAIEEAAIVSLVGRNGVGRSTTLKAIAGLVEPDRGPILLDGKEQRGRRIFEIARSDVAYGPEGRLFFHHLTRGENLKLARQPARPHTPTCTMALPVRSSPRWPQTRPPLP